MKTTTIDTTPSRPVAKSQDRPQDKPPSSMILAKPLGDSDTPILLPKDIATRIESTATKILDLEDKLEALKQKLQDELVELGVRHVPFKSGVSAWIKSGNRETINVIRLRESGVSNVVIGRAAWGVKRETLIELGVGEDVIKAATSETPWVAAGVTRARAKTDKTKDNA